MKFEDSLEVGFPCLVEQTPGTELHTPVVPLDSITIDETPLSGDTEASTHTGMLLASVSHVL